MKRYLWLDDEPARDPVSDEWHICRTAEEAIEYLSAHPNDVLLASLDHDLGIRKSGRHVVEFMLRERIFPPVINVHSMNLWAAEEMVLMLTHGTYQYEKAPFGVTVKLWQFTPDLAPDLVEFATG